MKNKIICLIFAMVLVIGMLASCDGGNGEGGNGGNTVDPNVKYNWDNTELLFQMNLHSQNDELSSGVKRYYAGDTSDTDEIDDFVETRNKAAYEKAKVTVVYKYLEDKKDEYAWGSNSDTIFKTASSGGDSAPDMYCNFAYDMTCAAIKGAFANLYSTKYDSNGNGKGENYFRFTEADYNPDLTGNFFDSTAGEGYFKAYMDSLSLVEGKAYCLASDYCTDLVRAFLVVPVNVNLLKQVDAAAIGLETSSADGKYTVEDFYKMVWAGGWTYDVVAKISNNIFRDTNKDNNTEGATAGLGDQIGFAAGVSSGLTGSGLLYTTDVSIIDRTTLTYPLENTTLNTVASKLNNLFRNNKSAGVCTVSDDAAVGMGYSDDLNAIREEFAENRVLFGGVVAVGSLEDKVYQDMKAEDGFGIVPVPVYDSGKEYKTLVHNLARIVAIGVVTSEFEQCTAFLNAVSTTSSQVLNQYYTVTLETAVAGGEAGQNNVQMLTYIRNHVNDCFDKTYEDMISYYNKNDKNTITWHNYLMAANYQADTFGTTYGTYASSKNGVLTELKSQWGKLN